jgi:hypothetical protein
LTDFPQIAILEMVNEIINSLKLKKDTLATEKTKIFAAFVDQLDKMEKNIKKMPSFYNWVVGLDLFGDELGYPYCPFVVRQFIDYIKSRREYNKRFGLRIHCGENVIFADDNSAAYRLFIAHMYIVFLSLRFLRQELKSGIRIGHGIAFEHILDENSMSKSKHRKSSILLAEMRHHVQSLFKEIAFEVNITSNEYLLGQTLRRGDYAHILRLNSLFKYKAPIILATDDDGIWPIDRCSFVHPGHQSLAAEYCRAISSSLISKDEHLNHIIRSTQKFCFWDTEQNRQGNTEQDTIDHPPDDDDDDDDDDVDNITNTIIIHPDIIKRICERYNNRDVKRAHFKTRWQQLLKGKQCNVTWQNNAIETMQHVAFICFCANSEEVDNKKDLIYEEYKELFYPHDYFDFIYENWKKIRHEFVSLDGDRNCPPLGRRVFIEKSPLWKRIKKPVLQVKIHAFGPNMINNDNVEELERFATFYPNYIKKQDMSVVIYTNNDKNTYHYHETSESFKIEVNPNPSKRDTQRENFLYVLCEHASAATAALHCISDHIVHDIAQGESSTNDHDQKVLDVFDSDMTPQMLLKYGLRNQSEMDIKLKEVLYNILKELSKRQESNQQNLKENDLIEALRNHRLVSFLYY